MIRVFCNCCNLEIEESEEGIPVKEIAVGIDESGNPTHGIIIDVDDDGDDGRHDVGDDDGDDDGKAPILRLVFDVVDENGEAEGVNIHICMRCSQILLSEYAEKSPDK